MNCPLCKKELLLIGEPYNQPNIIGWDCPTKTIIPYYKGQEKIDVLKPHYSVRGARADVIIFPYKIETWQVPDEYPGVSAVYHFVEGSGERWEKIFSSPAITITTEARLLERLQLLTVFS